MWLCHKVPLGCSCSRRSAAGWGRGCMLQLLAAVLAVDDQKAAAGSARDLPRPPTLPPGCRWTSGACDPRCRICIFMGKSDPGAPAHQQQSMVLVPMDAPGVTVGCALACTMQRLGPGSYVRPACILAAAGARICMHPGAWLRGSTHAALHPPSPPPPPPPPPPPSPAGGAPDAGVWLRRRAARARGDALHRRHPAAREHAAGPGPGLRDRAGAAGAGAAAPLHAPGGWAGARARARACRAARRAALLGRCSAAGQGWSTGPMPLLLRDDAQSGVLPRCSWLPGSHAHRTPQPLASSGTSAARPPPLTHPPGPRRWAWRSVHWS
jgi:hypothetical protein